MSGFIFDILLEVKNNIEYRTIHDFVKPFDFFIKEYIKEIGIEIISSSYNVEPNNVELVFFDSEWPYTSFIIFFEKYNGVFKYISLNDGDNNATDLIIRDDFFDRLIVDLNNNFKIKQAVFMCDPVFKTYEEVFHDISKGVNIEKLDIRKYWPPNSLEAVK